MSHNKLLTRLYSYGICGLVLEWTKEFFRVRTHHTRVGECLSPCAELLSGVVQGSGIGPALFLIYIDDLAKLLERNGFTAKLFADDVKVYLEVVEKEHRRFADKTFHRQDVSPTDVSPTDGETSVGETSCRRNVCRRNVRTPSKMQMWPNCRALLTWLPVGPHNGSCRYL